MKITIRIDSTNDVHMRFTVFQDGGNCGQLCMNTKEGNMFIDALCENPYFVTEVKLADGLA